MASCLPSREPVTFSTTVSGLKLRDSAVCLKVSAADDAACAAATEATCAPFCSASRQRSAVALQD
jgi:hypothetical protein